MEGQIKVSARAAALWLAAGLLIVPAARAQETAGVAGETGDITLRKNAQSREYNGQEFEGEDRVIVPGDSMWQILVKEKGVPEARFGQVLVVVRGLNPQIRSLDVLRVGDKIFIPANREYARAPASSPPKKEEARPAGRGTTRDYRVKAGDHLYQILREQFAVRDDREWAQYYLLVKDLNPQRKNWDVLLEGELIRLPERMSRVKLRSLAKPKRVRRPRCRKRCRWTAKFRNRRARRPRRRSVWIIRSIADAREYGAVGASGASLRRRTGNRRRRDFSP